MILAIDTSAAQCAAVLLSGGDARSRVEPMDRGHAERLMPMIGQVMAEADAGFSDLAAVAVCTGPGSFTGLRVGVAAARGIAMGAGIPAMGVTRFELLARASSLPCTVLIDGRGGGGFAQSFGADGFALGPAEAGQLEVLESEAPHPVTSAGLPDTLLLAKIALERLRDPGPPPAPLYVRAANADLPREAPPVILT